MIKNVIMGKDDTELTVSNSSRNALFSLAGRDAIRADSERNVAWSFCVWPGRSYE